MTDYTSDIRSIRGIGEKKAQAFNMLGVFSLFDLISCFPRRYEDRSTVKEIADTTAGESVCIRAVISDEPRLQRVRRGLELVKFRAVDQSGVVDITYFNQPYIRQQIHRGDEFRFFGRIELQGIRRSMINPIFEPENGISGTEALTGRIVPIYRLTSGLNQKTMIQSIRQSLNVAEIPEVLPASVRGNLPEAPLAYENIHFPSDWQTLDAARRRFVFEELFLLSCALGQRRNEVGHGILLSKPDFTPFYQSLPFSPTKAQCNAVEEASADLSSGRQMNRLLQGDVGSGKTLVAAALIWQCVQNGYLSAFMAPTEILAEQHYRTLSAFLSPLGIRIGLLTGSMSVSDKKAVKDRLEKEKLDLIIGTHALLGLKLPRLALAVTDEQHRFGVDQRAALISSGDDSGTAPQPHVLVMSATPIPRTLALIIYGDLDVSVLDELPPGRQPVDTFCVGSAYHTRLLAFIRKLCAEGRQVFVVCPKVEEDETEEDEPPERSLLSAVDYAEKLQKELSELRIGCVHGRLRSVEKDSVMQDFMNGKIQVLVSTTVIEVGVDVPNAALMLIENAERFGLSQLHQLRGRVGRGKHKSYCVLVTDHDSEETRARMKIMCETTDGFRIAEEDLRLRGPGDFFGSRQHGLPELHVADLGTDTDTLMNAKKAADSLLAEDPKLEHYPLLKQRVDLLLEKTGGTLN